MSIKIAKIESYIQKTYQTMGERYYAFYWNQGYINCLKRNRMISIFEERDLTAYNEKVNMMESLEIGLRKKKIKEEELKRMNLERIKKRIEERIEKFHKVYGSRTGFTQFESHLIDDIKKMSGEAIKALCLYKELVKRMYEIRHDDMPFKNCRMVEDISKLEEKFYPQPKTTKEKLTGIINERLDLTRIQSLDGLKKALIELRDEIED